MLSFKGSLLLVDTVNTNHEMSITIVIRDKIVEFAYLTLWYYMCFFVQNSFAIGNMVMQIVNLEEVGRVWLEFLPSMHDLQSLTFGTERKSMDEG